MNLDFVSWIEADDDARLNEALEQLLGPAWSNLIPDTTVNYPSFYANTLKMADRAFKNDPRAQPVVDFIRRWEKPQKLAMGAFVLQAMSRVIPQGFGKSIEMMSDLMKVGLTAPGRWTSVYTQLVPGKLPIPVKEKIIGALSAKL